jgi:DNA-binding helix-hairpin-helix protein with protein kinase domain
MALSSRTIAAASIAGIGDKTCANLSRVGIRTAADVSYGRAQAVDGIGPAKAAALDRWRRGIEQQARAAATILPAAESDHIKQRAAAAIRELDGSERQVREIAARNAQSARQKAIHERQALEAKLKLLDVEAQRRDADAERASVEAQKAADREESQIAQAEQVEAVYSEVTFVAFLKGPLSL